jgi:Putative auto-transporter adhesin, head GIN domain
MPNSIFAKAGFVLSLLSLTLVCAQARNGNDFTPREPSLKQSDHWEWAWDGSDSLGVGLTGAKVHYVPTGPARITITGPHEALEQVRVGQGQIRWCQDCRGRKGLEITVSGVALRNVALGGADIDMQLGRLDQDRLNVSLAGTGEISAGGRIDRLELSIAGSGNVRMGDARVQRADIHIAGSGDVTVTPREEANVHVAGSGNVRVRAMPPRLNQFITGSGGVRVIGN